MSSKPGAILFEAKLMNEFEQRLHRTWLALLLEWNYREIAALVVDADLSSLDGNFSTYGLIIEVPPSAYSLIFDNPLIQENIERTLQLVCKGHFRTEDGNAFDYITIEYRVKLLDVEENWRAVVKEMIVQMKEPNQGVVTEKLFSRKKQQVYLYNEMKFASQSEIRIAQEFERKKVLFFPLPLAVRSETGTMFQDHREVDFLVCQDGVWGILEVSYHPDRFEKDAEKDSWFKTSGILCIQHYSAERCYKESSEVVNEFLKILAKYRR